MMAEQSSPIEFTLNPYVFYLLPVYLLAPYAKNLREVRNYCIEALISCLSIALNCFSLSLGMIMLIPCVLYQATTVNHNVYPEGMVTN